MAWPGRSIVLPACVVVMTALGGYRLLDTKRNSIHLYAGLRRGSLDGDLRLTGGAATDPLREP